MRRGSRWQGALAALAAGAVLALCAGGATADGVARQPSDARPAAATGRAGVPAFRHVFIVLMENLDDTSALGTPGLAALARRYASATNYYAVSHPSLPNYLALTSGSTWGINSDCVDCYVKAPNVFSQLAAAHLSFGAYFEGMPNACDLDPYGGVDYAGKHNPFRYYDDVRASPSLCAHIEPYGRLPVLLKGAAGGVPRYVWVTPDLCDDGHDCAPAHAAAWLDGFIAAVTASAAWRDGGVLFVTWDESDGDDRAVVAPGRIVAAGGGGHVLTLVIAPGLRRGLTVATDYNHYSLLATIEDAFQLPLLGAAKTATPMTAFFH